MVSIFCLASVSGWILEVAFRSIVTGSFVNPGFLEGPWLPIYGFGVCLFYLACDGHGKTTSFIRIVILASLLEFGVSWFFENVFGELLWDYSGLPFSIGSRVNLFFALIWGCLGLWVVRHIEPKLQKIYLDYTWLLNVLCRVQLLIMIVDTVYSVWIGLL
jgi:uncharacterized membrane protein